MEQQIIANGGMQYVPQIAVQYVYLDFDGELTSYNGEILTVENVEVQNSSLTEERIADIVAGLNAKYASQNVIFVTDKPTTAEYSTIYIGKTDAFDQYGSFAGLAETIDHGNENRSDNAFVMLDSTSSDETIISTISHETDHLLGTLNHGGEGIKAYAADYYISQGKIANGIVLSTNDCMVIYSAGIANDTILDHANAKLDVLSGGTANNTIINSGYMLIDYGGTANGITINKGSATVEHNAVVNEVSFTGKGSLSVSGTLNSVTVNSSNSVHFAASATATAVKENGGYISIEDGANVSFVENTFSDFAISRAVTVHSNTTALRNTINSSGVLVVSGGTANSNTVNYGGRVDLLNSGVANNTTINNGGWVRIYSAGIANDTILDHANAKLDVLSGGTANNTIINSGYMLIDYGGTANGITINKGSATVKHNAAINNTTITSGDVYISSGGVANSTTVNLLGRVYVSSGGTINETTINDNGYVHIYSGGTANSTVINRNGGLFISSGGSANNTVAYGMFGHAYNATLSNTTLNSGGYTNVSSGTVAKKTTVNSRGSMFVSYGGTATDIMVNSGGWFGMSGGYVSNLTLKSGGQLGGFAFETDKHWDSITGYDIAIGTNATINNRYLCASSGASISGVTVYSASMNIDGGVASSLQINKGGAVQVLRGGAISEITVNSSGTLAMLGQKYGGGGVADNVIISSGGMISFDDSGSYLKDLTIKAGGSLVYLRFDSDRYWSEINFTGKVDISENVTYDCSSRIVVSNSGIASGIQMRSRAQMDVMSGGTAVKTVIDASERSAFTPRMIVASGGLASETTVIGSAALQVEDGGYATETTVISSGANLHCSAAATIEKTFLVSGGSGYIKDTEAYANETLIGDGGTFTLWNGTMTDTAIESSGRLFISSGTHKGTMQMDSGAVVSAYSGSIIDFTVTDRKTTDNYLINNLSLITGTPIYTITVSADQAYGTYQLAQGAENFEGSLSIGDGTVDYGDITVNDEKVVYGENCYILEEKNGDLTLTISAKNIGAPQNLQGSADGLSWDAIPGVEGYIVEYSTDNFANVITLETAANKVDSLALPSGTYQWRVKALGGEEVSNGENIISRQTVTEPQEYVSNADGNTDVFFANANGTWEIGYAAQHLGILNGWNGTGEQVTLTGKNKLADIFEGSSDANILVMTDDSNGDALFVDDIYTALPGTVDEQQARIAQIDEIRAGLGDDIVDMTSQRFAYVGDGVKIYGGLGNDTIWSNNGNNILFGDAGNDRLIGGANNDVIVGGIGNDRMHGGGGEDIFCFGENWGKDTVEQLAGGEITLWFESGSADNWDADTLTYTDGANSVTVSGISADNISLKFGDDSSELYDELANSGCFDDAVSEKIFEDKNSGMLA